MFPQSLSHNLFRKYFFRSFPVVIPNHTSTTITITKVPQKMAILSTPRLVQARSQIPQRVTTIPKIITFGAASFMYALVSLHFSGSLPSEAEH